MLQGARTVVRVDNDEFLYARWFRNWTNRESGRPPAYITPNQIDVPDQSVTRSGFGGRSWFVLMPEPGEARERVQRKLCQGILRFRKGDLPVSREHDGIKYVFGVEHDPYGHNYHHCEIRVYKNGVRIKATNQKEKKKIPKAVRDFFRGKMADAATWAIYPERLFRF